MENLNNGEWNKYGQKGLINVKSQNVMSTLVWIYSDRDNLNLKKIVIDNYKPLCNYYIRVSREGKKKYENIKY
jgi:hypothetical protein